MSNTNTGGPAFPLHPAISEKTGVQGMTLRDYFAAKAMHALISETRRIIRDDIAIAAYDMADAMLAERGKQ